MYNKNNIFNKTVQNKLDFFSFRFFSLKSCMVLVFPTCTQDCVVLLLLYKHMCIFHSSCINRSYLIIAFRMSNVIIDDELSRLKQFIWEELDENFFVAVIFRCVWERCFFFKEKINFSYVFFSSKRRYIVQRHFEQQLFDIKSSLIQNKWRRCLLDVISNSLLPLYITINEVNLMTDIFSWHLNYSNNYIKLRENIDYIIDFEDLIDCFKSISLDNRKNIYHNTNDFLIQPVTTLDAASKNIQMWKNLQEKMIEHTPIQTIEKQQRKRTRTPSKIDK
jgi:hypothetical protein